MIKTPKELLEFMSNISYEWMDKDGKFHNELVPEMYDTYSLMSPDEVLKYKKGICVDQSEFEREWFINHHYPHKIMVIEIDLADNKPGHVLAIYQENNKYYWFEHAWEAERGIHEYASYDELINDIKNKFIIQNDITSDRVDDIKIYEQPKYPYHLSYKEMDEYDSKIKKRTI